MNFSEYQKEAKKTIQKYVDRREVDEIIPFLGIIGETGSVITELKKKIRDGDGYTNFKPQLREELGDVLWYISTIATQNEINLEDVAKSNLEKTSDRFAEEDLTKFKNYDDEFPTEQQFEREFEICFKERQEKGKTYLEIVNSDGIRIGDQLTDNSYEDDGYRYHDIFHFGYIAYLGWSPVMRKNMKLKRKEDPEVDEVEDGARAEIVEELISLYVYSHAQSHQLFKYSNRIDTEILKTIQKMVANIEVRDCKAHQWETAIINSYRVYEELRKNQGGRVLVSIKNRKLIYLGKN